MNVRVLVTVAAACAVLAGCASVTSDINFQAPGAGWTASPPILGRTQIWVKQGTGSNENSMVILVRGAGTSQNVFDNPGIGANRNMRMVKHEETKICGSQPAEHAVGAGSSNGRQAVFEAYASSVHGEKYLAMYIRPQDQQPDDQAENAIKSLCAK